MIRLNIRNAGTDDALAIAVIQVEASRAAYESFVPSGYFDGLTVSRRTAVWKQLIAATRGGEHALVGEEGERLLAYAHYGRSRDLDALESTGELYSLYVAPARWRRGFGQQMLAASLRGLASMGFDKATLWVLAANWPARRFYERRGWTADGVERAINSGIMEARYWTSTCRIKSSAEPFEPPTSGNLAIMFRDYLERWALTRDGELIITPTSRLLPVRWGGAPAMLKIAVLEEERIGGVLMTWWNGHGAARVLAHDENAILMERAEDRTALADMARNGRDDEASRIICAVLDKLHAPRDRPPPSLVPLAQWFDALGIAAQAHGGILSFAAATAAKLLATQRNIAVLHGDMHHGNVLDFGARGWLAIDPKGLVGERSFDYANIFCNPDDEMVMIPGRLARQVQVVSETAHLDRNRLLAWIVAWAGLSAAFGIDDGLPPDGALRIAELAAIELSR